MGPVGAMIMSGFAFLFCLLAQFNGAPIPRAALALPFIVSLAIIGVAFRRQKERTGAETPEDERIGRVIMWSSAGEGIGIFLVVNILRNVGLGDRLMPGIAAVVGLHFLPMAALIPFPRFYALAVALIGVAIAACFTSAELGALLAGLGAALALWVAAALALMPRAAVATSSRFVQPQ